MKAPLASALLLLTASPAFALTDPPPCTPMRDSRLRCVNYDENDTVRIVGLVGSSVTLRFAPGATVMDPAGAMVETDSKAANDKKEWHGVPDGNLLHLQPLKSGLPTTMVTVPVQMPNGGPILTHVFELSVNGNNEGRLARLVTETEQPNADLRARMNRDVMTMVTFRYPDLEAEQRAKAEEAARAAAEAARAAAAVQAAAIRAQRVSLAGDTRQQAIGASLRTEAFYGNRDRNWRYGSRGEATLEPMEVSDNGLDTVLRFDPARPMPRPYLTESDKCDGEKSEVIATFEMLAPGTMRIHGSHGIICLRRSQKAIEVRNCQLAPSLEVCFANDPAANFNPNGSNPETGTISPGVVRTVRRAAR
jgi:type IV secretory pathway VirB9-like protein